MRAISAFITTWLTISQADYRKELERKIRANGGDYKPNLTKEETHLIAKEPSGAKYDFAEKWGVKTVAVDWLEQSLERGMILEESLFHPRLTADRRGIGAWIRKGTSNESLGKRTRDHDTDPNVSRKLRRTASAKLESQNSGIWGDIVLEEVKPEPLKQSAWDGNESPDRGQSDNAAVKPLNGGEGKQLQRASSLGDFVHSNDKWKGAIFHNKVFMLHGFDTKKATLLERHLTSHGARVIDTTQLSSATNIADAEHPFLLIPHDMPPAEVPAIASECLHPITVTEFWVERCLYRKHFEEPFTRVTNRPFPHRSIPGFERLSVCSTAFQGIDLLHMSKVVKLMGAKYEEYFDSTASVLICNAVDPGIDKLRHAQLWQVPAVRPEWLWDCVANGQLLPFASYVVQPTGVPEPLRAGSHSPERSKQSANAPRDRIRFLEESGRKAAKQQPSLLDKRSSSKKSDSRLIRPDKPKSNPFPDDAGPQMDSVPDDAPFQSAPVGSSSRTLSKNSSSFPLREITPNSSPPKPLPPNEDTEPQPASQKQGPSPSSRVSIPPQDQDESLGPAISSLLAHHQRNSSNAAASKQPSANPSHPRRRRRQLLGRAPSNISSHSINLSRASSVDTMNTDGLGTPLESTSFAVATNRSRTAAGAAPSGVVYDNDHEEELKKQEEQLQMTQLGYEDPDVKLWRERVARKIGGGDKAVGKGDTTTTASASKLGNAAAAAAVPRVGQGGLGISKRTRQAVGR